MSEITIHITGQEPGSTAVWTVTSVDAAGVESAPSAGLTVTQAAADNAPTVTAFTIPATASSLTVPITTFTAADDVGVTAWMITENATPPSAGGAGWNTITPATGVGIVGVSYTFASAGSKTLYAWVKDTAGNVSAGVSATVAITISFTANIAPAKATGKAQALTATATSPGAVVASMAPAAAAGRATPLVATASSSLPFLTLQGADGATFPMYTGSGGVGLQTH